MCESDEETSELSQHVTSPTWGRGQFNVKFRIKIIRKSITPHYLGLTNSPFASRSLANGFMVTTEAPSFNEREYWGMRLCGQSATRWQTRVTGNGQSLSFAWGGLLTGEESLITL